MWNELLEFRKGNCCRFPTFSFSFCDEATPKLFLLVLKLPEAGFEDQPPARGFRRNPLKNWFLPEPLLSFL